MTFALKIFLSLPSLDVFSTSSLHISTLADGRLFSFSSLLTCLGG
jgi:hypothetical protein